MKQFARYRETVPDLIAELLKEWSDWKQGKAIGQGWGGGVDMEGKTQRMPGVHTDPVLAEFMRTLVDGQAIYQFIDSRIIEHSQPTPRLLLAHYGMRASFEVIAQALRVERHIVRSMHERIFNSISDDILRHIKASRGDPKIMDYRWRVERALA